jgi:hypothetical protein
MCVKPLTVLKRFSESGGLRLVKFGQDEISGRTLWNQLSSDKRWEAGILLNKTPSPEEKQKRIR